MPQDNPVQPLLNLRSKIGSLARRFSGDASGSSSNDDTSWHDEQVKEANDSFRKAAEEKAPDHKAAVHQMNPEHVHHLVREAHAGKYGPEAQKMAHAAMQPQQQSESKDPSFTVTNPFSDDDDQGGSQPANAQSIFGRQ